jgi:hypothetical protein
MAQKKPQYEHAADSIFNFIFANAERNIRPAKPPIPSGATGNEMADALSEIALRPGMYVNDNIVTLPLQEFSDKISLFEQKLKIQEGLDLKIEVKGSTLADFLTDPESLIEKAFTKKDAIRKSARDLNLIRGFGGIMDLGIGAIIAKKAGASSGQAISVGLNIGNEYMTSSMRNDRAEQLAAGISAFQISRDLGRDHAYGEKLAKDLYHALDITREERKVMSQRDAQALLASRLQRYGYHDTNEVNDIIRRHLNTEKVNGKFFKDKNKSWNLGEIDKSVDVRNDRMLDFTSTSEWGKSGNPATRLRYLEMKKLLHEYATVASRPDSDPDKIRLRKQIASLKIFQVSNGNRMQMSRLFGEAHLHFKAFNDMVLEGGGLPALLNGDFWNPYTNHWSPSKDDGVTIQAFNKGFKFEGLKLPKNMNSRYDRTFTNLYYYHPASVFRTFFVTGEGAIYRAAMQQEGLMSAIRGSSELFDLTRNNPGLFRNMLQGVDVRNEKKVLDALSNDYMSLLEVLQENPDIIDTDSMKNLFNKMDLVANKLKNSKFLKYAQFLQKFWAKVKEKSPGALMNKLVKKVLLIGLTKVVGKKMAEKFLTGAVGLRFLVRRGVKAAVHAVLQALGIAFSGALANFLIAVLTEVVLFIAEKMLKPLVKILTFFAWGSLAVIFILFIGMIQALSGINPFSSHADQFNTAAQVPPIKCVECAAYIEDILDIKFDPKLHAEEDKCPEVEDFLLKGYIWPVQHTEANAHKEMVTNSPYGMRYLKGKWKNHAGIDRSDNLGTPILAAKDGKVISSGWGGSYGYVVEIDHGDNFSTLYAHLLQDGLHQVGAVNRGDIIGYMGSTGVDSQGNSTSTGSHLHFELRYEGMAYNPRCIFPDLTVSK